MAATTKKNLPENVTSKTGSSAAWWRSRSGKMTAVCDLAEQAIMITTVEYAKEMTSAARADKLKKLKDF